MAANPQLAALRALAKARHRAAGKKVSRIERDNSKPMLRGTAHDPRRDLSKVGKYNARQLETYINKLDIFISRKTQFVSDAYNKPIPIQTWRKWQAAEAARNKRKADLFNKVKDLQLPTGHGTIGELEQRTRPSRPEMARPAEVNPYTPSFRKSTSFTSEKSLKRMLKKAEKQWSSQDIKKRTKRARETIKKMAPYFDKDGSLGRRIDKLSDYQLNILWNYTGRFSEQASMKYEMMKNSLSWREQADPSQLEGLDNAIDEELDSLVSWAETL